jgi:transposase
MPPESSLNEEGLMLSQDRWEEIRRLRFAERVAVAEIARRLDVDRKTVRRCLREPQWQPYRRAARDDTLLAPHAEYLRERAPQVNYSARILYQELRASREFRGSYETVKLAVRPLRATAALAECTERRFETPPGRQSQIDWGQARVRFRHQPRELHLFVLTLGFSRRGYYCTYPNEQLGAFLDAHEAAFAHFGGHTHEHLYDRPRTVCRPVAGGRIEWNPTFRAFADYWGFEPRLCRAYRARTKGKVESGVKYVKRNFLPGRRFLDQADFDAQLAEWTATVADVRIHGTVHEQPLARFAREQPHLIPIAGQPSFRVAVPVSRIVADDYLVSFQTNRYSVPCTLIGHTVEVHRCGESLEFHHRGECVARHPPLAGQYQMRILPEHGPGAIARTARRRFSSVPMPGEHVPAPAPQVEVRYLAVYEALLGTAAPSREVTP